MVEKNLDFRSDTTTWPSPEMREAAAKAAVGDMGYGEDPSVNELERVAAEIFGKEAAIFCTSGTQGNIVAMLAHTNKGDSFICEARAHIYTMEKAHWATIGSLYPKLVAGEEGFLPPEAIRAAKGRGGGNNPKTSLVCIENTHLSSGGTAIPVEKMKINYDVAKELDMGVHTDGARIFNAATSLGIKVDKIAQYTDTVQACLSKGLAAPVGSVMAGSKELVEKAKYYRGMLGGNMRQAGIIAAPGILALTTMVDRLKEDHDNAKLLGDGLQKLGINLRFPVKSNMLFIDYSSIGWKADDWSNACAKLGWKSRGGAYGTRLVVHYGMEREDIEALLEGLAKLI